MERWAQHCVTVRLTKMALLLFGRSSLVGVAKGPIDGAHQVADLVDFGQDYTEVDQVVKALGTGGVARHAGAAGDDVGAVGVLALQMAQVRSIMPWCTQKAGSPGEL